MESPSISEPSFEEIQIPVPFGFVSGKYWSRIINYYLETRVFIVIGVRRLFSHGIPVFLNIPSSIQKLLPKIF